MFLCWKDQFVLEFTVYDEDKIGIIVNAMFDEEFQILTRGRVCVRGFVVGV